MEVVGIIGDRGAGKTCLMTDLLYKDYLEGVNIIANYKLNFPVNYMKFEQVAELPESIKNSSMGFDELGVGANSRAFFKKSNQKIAELVMQLRKRNCLLYYTVQRLNLIEKRIREQTDAFILMKATPKKGFFRGAVLDGETQDTLKDFVFNGNKIFDLYDTNEIIKFDEEVD